MKISKALKDTVKANPHIQEVHFTESGEHFFNAHEHKEKGSSKVLGKYGRMGVEAVHVRNEGDRKIYKNEQVPLPEYKIVKTVSREDILNAEVAGEVNIEKVMEESHAEKAKLEAENEKLKAEVEKLKKKNGQ